ncbi:fucose 4-O-acetylase [Photobacterium sanctipauli]|uniref:Fucose 4-O-acetylase n=1 Tax=Photobacterium sanctipauli TaxID=1342794 RepID=A0A2T3NZ06_9GAMM|nr:acyltransferase family protein [Photobacterium sanctipauli]PSW21470.1 fucose 4-O-acetylase [Photobacterium sanctipauli]
MNKDRIASFEWGRLIALLAVIIIHAKPFMNAPIIDELPWVGLLLNQLGRFAVPLFFILAGYFIMPKLSEMALPTLKRYSLPLLKVWLAWSIIYLAMPFNLMKFYTEGYLAERSGYWNFLLSNPLNTLFEGGMVHLWYIPGLICGLAVIALCCALKQQKLILPVAVALYVYGLMAGSYQPIFGIEAPVFTRNGPFLSTLMIAIGFMARKHNYKLPFVIAALLAIGGMGLHLLEGLFLLKQHGTAYNINDFLMGTPLWAAGIFFMLADKPDFGRSPALFKLSKDILGIYLVHLLIIIYTLNTFRILGFSGYVADISVIAIVCVVSYVIVKLIDKTPLKNVLLR